jgi:hypothetical protein
VRLKAGDDIVAACQPFAQDIGEHATRLGLDDADSERIIALNMSACITVCGFFETRSGGPARITRVECYGGDLEESASNAEHRASVKKALYNTNMLPRGHLSACSSSPSRVACSPMSCAKGWQAATISSPAFSRT